MSEWLRCSGGWMAATYETRDDRRADDSRHSGNREFMTWGVCWRVDLPRRYAFRCSHPASRNNRNHKHNIFYWETSSHCSNSQYATLLTVLRCFLTYVLLLYQLILSFFCDVTRCTLPTISTIDRKYVLSFIFFLQLF